MAEEELPVDQGKTKEISTDDDEIFAPEQDWLLEKIVSMLNRGETDNTFAMTLNVGGTIVSGMVIGGREYFTLFGERMAEGQDDENHKLVVDFFGGARDSYGPNGSMSDTPGYIHMRDARFFSSAGKPIPGNAGLLWRARLTAVDAFSMGVLMVAED